MTDREEVLNRLYNLAEYETVKHIHELSSVNKIHFLNFHSFKRHLETLPQLKSSVPGNQFNFSIYAKIEKYTFEFKALQLLNNYISSAFSVIDYTRRHYEKYYKGKEILEYEQKIKKEFDKNPFHRFMQDLRNYAIHYSIPSLSTVKQIKPINNETTTRHYTTINLKRLSESSYEWKSLSKKYLDDRDTDEVEILPLFESYFDHLNEFQKWYSNEQQKLFASELMTIKEAEDNFSSMIFNNLMNHIKSRKGYNYEFIENRLLHCFSYDCQVEILSVEDINERLNLILDKLKTKVPIAAIDMHSLLLTTRRE